MAVLALAVPLSSCGFDYATDRDYTPAGGANNREGDVDVLSAVVVSAAEGSGTFIASLSNNDPDEPETFTGVAGEEEGSITAEEFEPVEIAPGGLVNLAEPPAEIVHGGLGDELEQRVPVLDPLVEGGSADPDAVGDGLHRDARRTARLEQLTGRVDDRGEGRAVGGRHPDLLHGY